MTNIRKGKVEKLKAWLAALLSVSLAHIITKHAYKPHTVSVSGSGAGSATGTGAAAASAGAHAGA